MSEILTEKHYGVPTWAWVLTGFGAVITAGVLLYKYFIEPAEVILDQYRYILQDIYAETKGFLEENEKEGIYGLTAGQEAILAAKQQAADELRPQVEAIITQRNQVLWTWVETAIIGIIVVFAVPYVAEKLIKLLKQWRADNPEASSKTASQYGHGHIVFELVANDFAYQGRLGIASAFYTATIPNIYAVHTQPALVSQTAYYNALLPSLIPGSLNYLVAQQMLSYLTYEASAATGIMAILHSWWLPPLI